MPNEVNLLPVLLCKSASVFNELQLVLWISSVWTCPPVHDVIGRRLRCQDSDLRARMQHLVVAVRSERLISLFCQHIPPNRCEVLKDPVMLDWVKDISGEGLMIPKSGIDVSLVS